MLLISHNRNSKKRKHLQIDHLKLDGNLTKSTIESEIQKSTAPLDNTMAPFATATLPPQQPSLESLVLEDVEDDYTSTSSTSSTIDVQPIKIEIAPAPKHRKSFSFSWGDFPLLQEDCVYVDSAWQKRKNAIAQSEFATTSQEPTKTTRPQHERKAASHKRSKTIATSGVFTQSVIKKGHKKSVSFDAVHIREHSVTIGDHDWCEGTLAVSLDWPHTIKPKSMFLDDYEHLRERQGRVSRGRLPKLDHLQRKHLLKHVGGVSDEDLQQIEDMESRCEDFRRQIAGLPRVMTIPNLPAAMQQVDEEMNAL